MHRRSRTQQRNDRRFRDIVRHIQVGADIRITRSRLAEIAGGRRSNIASVFRVLQISVLGERIRGSTATLAPRARDAGLAARHTSIRGAIEYTAALLLASVHRLRTFEIERSKDLVDLAGWETSDEATAASDEIGNHWDDEAFKEFGGSLWLTSIQIRTARGLERQVQLAREVIAARPAPIVSLAIRKIYEFATSSMTARQIHDRIEASKFSEDVKGFLLALLHPAPTLTEERIVGALTLASECPALDQWLILLRCCQALHAQGNGSVLTRTTALPRLLSSVSSIETAQLLTHVFGIENHVDFEITMPEAGILATFYGVMDAGVSRDGWARILAAPLEKVACNERKDIVASIAILDRLGATLAGGRLGSLVCATVAHLVVLTEHRAATAQRWIEITAHPRLAAEAARRPLFDAVLRRDLLPEEESVVRSAATLARACDWPAVAAQIPLLGQSREAAALSIDSLLNVKRIADAVKEAAEASVRFPDLLHRLPIAELIRAIPRERPKTVSECLAHATLLDLGVRHISTEYSRRRNFAVEDTLRAAGVDVPSKLAELHFDSTAERLLPSFLATICVPSVMDTIPIGATTKALLEERIRILQRLIERDGVPRRELEAEIVHLSGAIAVSAERASLDQQRVYVDIEGLTARLSENIREDFELYLRYRQLDLRHAAAADTERLIKEYALERTGISVFEPHDFIRHMASEAERHLMNVVTATRREFALGEDHGLDGYLSGGIRHGNLEALLRQPFQSADILGSFDSTGRFLPPRSFADLIRRAPPHDSGLVHEALRAFATDFQAIIARVLNEWIRIRIDETADDALFDFSISTANFRGLQATLGGVRTVDECVSHCVTYWWSRVVSCLGTARHRVRTRLRCELDGAVDRLVDTLTLVDDDILRELVPNVVGPVRADIEVTLEKLASWFEVGESFDAGDIEPSLVMAVAQSSVENLHPRIRFDWCCSSTESGARLSRRSMKHWVDILLTLFHNVVHHSRQTDAVRVSASLELEADCVIVAVSNPLGAEANIEAVDRAIVAVAAQVEAKAYMSAVRREGSTGLMKVLKTARIDLRSDDADLSLDHNEGGFHVRLRLPGLACIRGGASNATAVS